MPLPAVRARVIDVLVTVMLSVLLPSEAIAVVVTATLNAPDPATVPELW